jgi:hypothetical protein
MVLDEASATYRLGMMAHHHDASTSYLDPSTTHPSQGQKLHKEDLQRRFMGQDLVLEGTRKKFFHVGVITRCSFPVPEVDTMTQ